MKRVYAAIAVVVAVVLAACFLICRSFREQGTGEAQRDGVHTADRDARAGWKETGLPDPAEVTREEIKSRWPPDLKPHRPYRRLVLELAQYPLETRLQWYLRFARRLSAGGKGGSLDYLAMELTFQGEFEVLDALEGSLDRPRQKRAIHIYVGSGIRDERLGKYLKPGVVEEGRRLLRKWAVAHPENPSLLPHHPDGFRLLVRILGDVELDGDRRLEAAREIASMPWYVDTVSAEEAIRILEPFADDRTSVDSSIPGPDYCTLGGRVRERIETLRKYLIPGDSGNSGAIPAKDLTVEEIKKRWFSDSSPERPFKKLVEQLRRRRLEVRLRFYVEVAPKVVAVRWSSKNTALCVLLEELARQKELEVLEALETSMDNARVRGEIYTTVSSWTEHELGENPGSKDGERGRKLLNRWALANPDAMELAYYHPEGVDHLLSVIEDDKVDVEIRLHCAKTIGYIARAGNRVGFPRYPSYPIPNLWTDVIPRLRRLVNDDSQLHPPSRGTLGQAVGKVVEQLEAIQDKSGVIPPDGEEGQQQAGAPERSELTREEIEKRWLPEEPPPTPYDKPPGRPYRRLVEELLKYPLGVRLRYYGEVSQELPVAELYRPEDSRRNLSLLAEELVAQHDLPVLESLEKLLDRRRKEVLWISVSFWAGHELWDNPESSNGLTAKRLLEQWASENPDALVLSQHHPAGVSHMLNALEDDKASAETQYRWVWGIGEVARTGARLRLRSYPIPNVRTDVMR